MFRPLTLLGLVVLIAVVAVASSMITNRYHSRHLDLDANSIMVIQPYRHAGTWVFDDARTGLHREPFVGGVPAIIDALVQDIPNADSGFRLTFSATAFPEYHTHLRWLRPDGAGNWYHCSTTDREGWICPALLRYYAQPPSDLYVKVDPRSL